MRSGDLERVQADLDVVKRSCVEPAVPREDVGSLVALAGLGVTLAIAPWVVPMGWVKLGALIYVAVWCAVYMPRKLRLLTRPERALEAKEYWVWGAAGVFLVAYVLYSRLAIPRWAPVEAQSWQRDAGTVFFFLGTALLAGALVHPTRRPMLAIGAAMIAAGVWMPFAASISIGYAIMGTALAVGCLGTAAGYEYLARQQRREHGGD